MAIAAGFVPASGRAATKSAKCPGLFVFTGLIGDCPCLALTCGRLPDLLQAKRIALGMGRAGARIRDSFRVGIAKFVRGGIVVATSNCGEQEWAQTTLRRDVWFRTIWSLRNSSWMGFECCELWAWFGESWCVQGRFSEPSAQACKRFLAATLLS